MVMVFCALLVGALSFLLTRWLASPNSPIRILDQPNERSLHSTPVSRTGGLAIFVSLFIGVIFISFGLDIQLVPGNILYGAILIIVLAIVDDCFGLSPLIRLCVQFAAALLLVNDGFLIEGQVLPGVYLNTQSGIVMLLTITFTLWLINLYNFMDGMDGFAGGMAVIGFGSLAILGMMQREVYFAASALIICTASAGFLWFNFPPAKIFMGDTGSTTLGFLVAAFSIWASRADVADVWLSLLIFSPFVVDASVTLLRRLTKREPIWQAHRSHYYQRLVQMGWGHRRTVLFEYSLMLFCSVSAIVIHDQTHIIQWLVLTIIAFCYISAVVVVSKLESKRRGSIS